MITIGDLNGHEAVFLDNGLLRACVLPRKGADICELTYLPKHTQFLMQTPSGLKPPKSTPPTDFLENYPGGWQELFPNHNDACCVKGIEIPFHGEVALLPWNYTIIEDTSTTTSLGLSVQCRQTPFRLERRMTMKTGQTALSVAGQVANTGNEAWPLVWGHHLTLGGNFLEGGCRLETPAELILTPDELYEPSTARLAEKQISRWPLAKGRQLEEWVDLQEIPGPEAHSHDDAFLTGFSHGLLIVSNPRLKLDFKLEWDASIFPWLTFWQPLGGADLPPLTGIYGIGIEPWVSRYNLAGALENGQAILLQPGQVLKSEIKITIQEH